MNPVFWVMVIAALTLLWFLLAFAFRPVGKVASRIWDDAIEEINKEDEEREEK